MDEATGDSRIMKMIEAQLREMDLLAHVLQRHYSSNKKKNKMET